MNEAIADGFLKWSQAVWEYHCPARGPDGRHCHETLEEFTTHSMICTYHGVIDKDTAIPWASCA